MTCCNVKTDENEDAEPARTCLQHCGEDADVEVLFEKGHFAVSNIVQFFEEDVLQRVDLHEFDIVYSFCGGGDAFGSLFVHFLLVLFEEADKAVADDLKHEQHYAADEALPPRDVA